MLELEALTEKIIGAAIEVHREIGPGALESVYEEALCLELTQRGLNWQSQVELPVRYKGQLLRQGYRIDILVENLVVIENKAVEKLSPIHEAILINYLKLGRYPVGLMLNFHVARMVDGILRRANTRI